MGLDGVEMILAIEKEFGFNVEDEEMLQCTTVGELTMLVYMKTKQLGMGTEWFQRGLDDVRAFMAHHTNVPPEEINEDTPLIDLFRHNRRGLLRKLRTELHWIRTPSLKRPKWVVFLAALASFACVICTFNYYGTGWGILSVFAAPLTLALASRPFKIMFPKNYAIVKDLILAGKPLDGNINVEYLRERVYRIISEQLGVPLEQVKPHKRFLEDLGMD